MKDKNYFLAKAQENMPELHCRNIIPDATEFIGSDGDSVLLDLGEHAVGHFSFAFDILRNNSRKSYNALCL